MKIIHQTMDPIVNVINLLVKIVSRHISRYSFFHSIQPYLQFFFLSYLFNAKTRFKFAIQIASGEHEIISHSIVEFAFKFLAHTNPFSFSYH